MANELEPQGHNAWAASLPAASALTGSELQVVVQGGASKHTSIFAAVIAKLASGVSVLLSSYTVPITVLVASGSTVTVALAGGVYKWQPTTGTNITTFNVTMPPAGQVGYCSIDVEQPNPPITIVLPASRGDGYSTAMVETTAGSRTRIELYTNAFGELECRTSISTAA
jgi:hypothetical protein